jgi:hypothetical protein
MDPSNFVVGKDRRRVSNFDLHHRFRQAVIPTSSSILPSVSGCARSVPTTGHVFLTAFHLASIRAQPVVAQGQENAPEGAIFAHPSLYEQQNHLQDAINDNSIWGITVSSIYQWTGDHSPILDGKITNTDRSLLRIMDSVRDPDSSTNSKGEPLISCGLCGSGQC